MSPGEIAASRKAPRYWKIETGNCGNASMQPITDAALCEDAAMHLGLKDTIVGRTEAIDRPEGCYYVDTDVDTESGPQKLWIGTNPGNKGKGVETVLGATRHPI